MSTNRTSNTRVAWEGISVPDEQMDDGEINLQQKSSFIKNICVCVSVYLRYDCDPNKGLFYKIIFVLYSLHCTVSVTPNKQCEHTFYNTTSG